MTAQHQGSQRDISTRLGERPTPVHINCIDHTGRDTIRPLAPKSERSAERENPNHTNADLCEPHAHKALEISQRPALSRKSRDMGSF